MSAVCLFVAGALAASLADPAFTVAWTHSVAKTRWVESYVVVGPSLMLVEASIEGSGAGMEPPPEAVLRDGRWEWRPHRALAELVLARSAFAQDHQLCAASGCRALGALAGASPDDQVVVIRACAAPPPGGNSAGGGRRSSDDTRSGNAPSLRSRK